MDSFLKTLSSFFQSESKGKQEDTFEEQLKKSREITKQISFAQSISPNVKNISGTNIYYEIISKLGKGGFGDVYQVSFPNYQTLNLENKSYALKVIKLKPNANIERHFQKNLNEKYISSRIQSESGCLKEFLCYYFPSNDVIIDNDSNIFYITELMDGDLQKLKSKMTFDQRIAFVNTYLYPIVKKGLLELHLIGLIHSDIKLQNILYKNNENDIEIKIGDLGSTCTEIFDQQTLESSDTKCKECKICLNTFAGTYSYVDPSQFEKYILMIYQSKTDKKHLWKQDADWYAFTITIINFLTDQNIIDDGYLKKVLNAAAYPKERSLQDLISIYRKYISSQFSRFKTNKQILLDYGLKKEIYDFIESKLEIPKTLESKQQVSTDFQ